MREAYARACATKQPRLYESVAYGENGEPNHTYLVRAVPLVAGDAVKLILLVPTDITERVRLERSLALSEQKLRLAVDATRMGLWSWDVARDEIRWDYRALEIFGVTEPPATYDWYLALIHPDDRALVVEVVGRACTTGVYTPFEHRLAPRGDGLERWALGTGTLLRDDAGKPSLLMGGVLEITAQKHAAAQLQRAQRVEALGQLSAGLAHNFNNLLGAIIPNLELALEQPATEQGPSLNAALSASLQARDLIKRLMAITAPRAPESSRVCDPREVIERAVVLCRASFPREIQLMSSVETDCSHVRMSASDLDQVLLNLLFNARDALEVTTGRARLIEVILEYGARRGPAERGAHPRARQRRGDVSRRSLARSSSRSSRRSRPTAAPGWAWRTCSSACATPTASSSATASPGGGTTSACCSPRRPARGERDVEGFVGGRFGRGRRSSSSTTSRPSARPWARLLTRRGYRVLEANNAEEARAMLEGQGRRDQAHPARPVDAARVRPRGAAFVEAAQRRARRAVHGRHQRPARGAAAVLEKPAQAADLLSLVGDRGPRRLSRQGASLAT